MYCIYKFSLAWYDTSILCLQSVTGHISLCLNKTRLLMLCVVSGWRWQGAPHQPQLRPHGRSSSCPHQPPNISTTSSTPSPVRPSLSPGTGQLDPRHRLWCPAEDPTGTGLTAHTSSVPPDTADPPEDGHVRHPQLDHHVGGPRCLGDHEDGPDGHRKIQLPVHSASVSYRG